MQSIITILIIVGVVLFFWFFYKSIKKFRFDSIVMINGAVGSGKSSLTVYQSIKAHKKAHAIWWRRTHIYYVFKKRLKYEEEPLLYSNIPLYKNYKKRILYKYYRPLTTEHLLRQKRFNFKSVILIDESSLVANSTSSVYSKANPMAQQINEGLTLFLKLLRHELHGCYRNIFGGYANLFVNTQSKNDNHFAFDRSLNQVLYITKNINIPFFRICFCRELLLIDSVENNFQDDFKEDLSNRWYLMPKSIFNKYDSYSYSFLSDDKDKINDISKFIVLSGRFEIATFVLYNEIQESNSMFKEYIKLKESENNGQQEMV